MAPDMSQLRKYDVMRKTLRERVVVDGEGKLLLQGPGYVHYWVPITEGC